MELRADQAYEPRTGTHGLSPRPAAPAGSPRYGGGAHGGAEEPPSLVPVGVTGHRTQRPRGQIGPPGPHPAQTSSPRAALPWTQTVPGGVKFPLLASLIAQLVKTQHAIATATAGGYVHPYWGEWVLDACDGHQRRAQLEAAN